VAENGSEEVSLSEGRTPVCHQQGVTGAHSRVVDGPQELSGPGLE
jgi:hypothetical protein